MLGRQPERCLRSRIEGLRQPNRLSALLPMDSGENAINPNAGILKISKQISDRYPFTINADQTEIHFTLNQNTRSTAMIRLGKGGGLLSMPRLWCDIPNEQTNDVLLKRSLLAGVFGDLGLRRSTA